MEIPWPHQPVLYQSIIQAIHPVSAGRYVDATVGAGGHSAGILESSSPSGQLLGFDLDPQALEIAEQRLGSYGDRLHLVQASNVTLTEQVHKLGWKGVHGIVIDLGVSSMQLDNAAKGFSFQSEAPLDMRFNPTQITTAADLVNNLPENELADILWRYGEERNSYRVARAICQARPLQTTTELARVIARASGGKHSRIHPATRSFQALRIAVNDELASLESVLPQAVDVLLPQGRLAVISFHSLEDRIVKQFFRQESKDCICPPEQPVCSCNHQASILEVTHRPIMPDESEIIGNARARSARLRIAEKRKLA